MYLLTYCSEELNFVWPVFGWRENARKRKQKCSFRKGKLVIYPYPMCFLPPLSLSPLFFKTKSLHKKAQNPKKNHY